MHDEDDNDTDHAVEDDSEDVKPASKLTRSPSVRHFKHVQITTDAILPGCRLILRCQVGRGWEKRKGELSSWFT